MTNEELHEHFVYEPATGMLRKIKNCRKPYPWRGIGPDQRYFATTFKGKCEYLHRLVWQYHTGEIASRIDHKDNNPKNCRIENLRPATAAQNQYNSPRKKNNKSGAKGVVFCKGYRNPWLAKITVDKKIIYIGRYADCNTAAQAYLAAAKHYAGEFAYPNPNGGT